MSFLLWTLDKILFLGVFPKKFLFKHPGILARFHRGKGAVYLESYRECRVIIYNVILQELRFLDSHIFKPFELYGKPNIGELVIKGDSPNC